MKPKTQREIWTDILKAGFPQGLSEFVTKACLEYLEGKYKVEEKKPAPVLIFPFDSEEFKTRWALLVEQPKWRKKTPAALQLSLKHLSRHPEPVAIAMIEQSISGGYQGLFEVKQAGKFTGNNSVSKMESTLNAMNSLLDKKPTNEGNNSQQSITE